MYILRCASDRQIELPWGLKISITGVKLTGFHYTLDSFTHMTSLFIHTAFSSDDLSSYVTCIKVMLPLISNGCLAVLL
jgi:hypothetical protein